MIPDSAPVTDDVTLGPENLKVLAKQSSSNLKKRLVRQEEEKREGFQVYFGSNHSLLVILCSTQDKSLSLPRKLLEYKEGRIFSTTSEEE